MCYVEIEPYCQEVLLYRMEGGRLDIAPIFEDVTLFRGCGWRGKVDLITGGFPCQDLSVAGKREGIDGTRSSLWREFARIIGEIRPRFVFVENVPGMLSPHRITLPIEDDEGNPILSEDEIPETGFAGIIPSAMGRVLGDLADIGYGVQWRVLDAQFFGVPQKRRRVFLVGYLGTPCPPEILFEPESGGGHSPKGGKAGKEVAFSLRANPSRSGDKGDGGINCTMIAQTLNSGGNDGGFRTEPGAHLIAHPLTSGGNDKRDTIRENYIASSLTSGSHPNSNAPGRRHEDDINLVTHALTCEGHDASEDGTGRGTPLVFQQNQRNEIRIMKQAGMKQQNYLHLNGVRRLTPTECERLQGFPDNWTFGSDSKRYKMLGNAVAVPVIQWIGSRIKESLTQ